MDQYVAAMPISPMDEYLAHQTPHPFDQVFTSDRNFYDRYYFNCHPCSEELFLITGMGMYPNLRVCDAFVTVAVKGVQYTVRASRELGSDRLDTSCGPFRVEILEGLRSLRVVCEPNEWDVEFDLVFHAATEVLEEPRSVMTSGPRITMDTSRYAQVGTWDGTLRVAGTDHDVSRDTWKGARDHSWGVRPVGDPEPPGIVLKDYDANFGLWHNWLPMQFDDHLVKVSIDEDPQGQRLVEEAVRIPALGVDGTADGDEEQLGRPQVDIDYLSGTREMASARVTFTDGPGEGLEIVNTPLRTVYLKAGSGYMNDGTWGHGVYQGDLVVQGLTHEVGDPTERLEIAGLNETLCRFETNDGQVGYGMHENMALGVHHPSGFTQGDTLAP